MTRRRLAVLAVAATSCALTAGCGDQGTATTSSSSVPAVTAPTLSVPASTAGKQTRSDREAAYRRFVKLAPAKAMAELEARAEHQDPDVQARERGRVAGTVRLLKKIVAAQRAYRAAHGTWAHTMTDIASSYPFSARDMQALGAYRAHRRGGEVRVYNGGRDDVFADLVWTDGAKIDWLCQGLPSQGCPADHSGALGAEYARLEP